MSKPLHIHILQEYGIDYRPHPTSYIRLMRPLTHPSIASQIDVSWGLRYESQQADAVILDRLWHRDVSVREVDDLACELEHRGVMLIYAIDDDLLSLPANQSGWPSEVHREIVKYLLERSSGVLVTTDELRERFLSFNTRIVVVPNALDERLLVRGKMINTYDPFSHRRKVIGYMGTKTHREDLKIISGALQVVHNRFPNEIELQIVGVANPDEVEEALDGIPFRVVHPPPGEEEYPQFMLWFSSKMRWDIGIAPLASNHFNQSKSDIKFLDYSSIGATGIFSSVGEYNNSVKHLETGWIANNDKTSWVDAIVSLLEDDHLRNKISLNATQYLYKQRTLKTQAVNWLQAIRWFLDHG